MCNEIAHNDLRLCFWSNLFFVSAINFQFDYLFVNNWLMKLFSSFSTRTQTFANLIHFLFKSLLYRLPFINFILTLNFFLSRPTVCLSVSFLSCRLLFFLSAHYNWLRRYPHTHFHCLILVFLFGFCPFVHAIKSVLHSPPPTTSIPQLPLLFFLDIFFFCAYLSSLSLSLSFSLSLSLSFLISSLVYWSSSPPSPSFETLKCGSTWSRRRRTLNESGATRRRTRPR